jgi:hypothetical protein
MTLGVEDLDVDRWEDPSDFPISPVEHNAHRIEFLDFKVEMETRESEENERYDDSALVTAMTYREINAVRLWDENGPREVVGLVDGGDPPEEYA